MKKIVFYLNLIPEIAVIVVTFLFALDEKYENDNELFLGFASFLSSILFFNLLFLCILPHNEGVCPSSNNCCDCDCDNGGYDNHESQDCGDCDGGDCNCNCDCKCKDDNSGEGFIIILVIILAIIVLFILFKLYKALGNKGRIILFHLFAGFISIMSLFLIYDQYEEKDSFTKIVIAVNIINLALSLLFQ